MKVRLKQRVTQETEGQSDDFRACQLQFEEVLPSTPENMGVMLSRLTLYTTLEDGFSFKMNKDYDLTIVAAPVSTT